MEVKKRNLEQIIEAEKKHRVEGGQFGIKACKECILWYVEHGEPLYAQLEGYVKRANEDIFFNRAMVLACWELINEQ